VLALAATASDTLVVVAYGAFNVANTYTQAEADARYPLNSINFVAGKNKIINGDFSNWQRGTSFSSAGYTADRWLFALSGATGSVSRQTFTPGTAPVAGYEGQFFLRLATTVADDNSRVEQKMEDVRTFAGQTVTVSFYAKADSARTITLEPYQNFGSGGSADVVVTSQTISVTTAWTRFTKTFAIPSVAGKTIGTSSFFSLEIKNAAFETFTLDLWGVQVEAGTVATAFQTATGTIQGELAACQRYYQMPIQQSNFVIANAGYYNTNLSLGCINLGITMRTTPSLVVAVGTNYYSIATNNASNSFDSFTMDTSSQFAVNIYNSSTTGVTGAFGQFRTANANSSIALSAEL
jgi:hypothetical protein